MGEIKLSAAQQALLEGLPKRAVDYYAPARKLVAMGLAYWTDTKLGHGMLRPTDAGVAWLAKRKERG